MVVPAVTNYSGGKLLFEDYINSGRYNIWDNIYNSGNSEYSIIEKEYKQCKVDLGTKFRT
jgi:hypothetical protein